MLPKKYRTPIQKFPRGAKTIYRGKRLVIKSFPNNLSYSRAGFVVAKSVSTRAVARNKTRRILADAFAKSAKVLKKPGKDHLVIMNASDKLDDTNIAELKKEITAAVHKLEK